RDLKSLLLRFAVATIRALYKHHEKISGWNSNFNRRTAPRLVLLNFGFMACTADLCEQLRGTLNVLKLRSSFGKGGQRNAFALSSCEQPFACFSCPGR